mgnify:CR=1 FL=1
MRQRNPDEYPETYGGKEPIYEMDPASGQPFSSPLALREVRTPLHLPLQRSQCNLCKHLIFTFLSTGQDQELFGH